MLAKYKKLIRVATRAELRDMHYYRRLWVAFNNLNVSRRDFLDELAATFRDYYMDDNLVIHASGIPYDLPDIDMVFGDDPEMRWLSLFRKSDQTGEHPNSMSRKYERLRLIDLYFRIKYPQIARHFPI